MAKTRCSNSWYAKTDFRSTPFLKTLFRVTSSLLSAHSSSKKQFVIPRWLQLFRDQNETFRKSVRMPVPKKNVISLFLPKKKKRYFGDLWPGVVFSSSRVITNCLIDIIIPLRTQTILRPIILALLPCLLGVLVLSCLCEIGVLDILRTYTY